MRYVCDFINSTKESGDVSDLPHDVTDLIGNPVEIVTAAAIPAANIEVRTFIHACALTLTEF